MELLTANLNGSTRRAQLNGRDHIVAPLTLIVPGVLNGSQGPLFYPQEEIAKGVDAWNGIPLVAYHPTNNGQPTSARSPDVFNRQRLGVIFNAAVNSEGKLQAEGWFDVEQTQRVDNRIFAALQSSQPIELSTGLFTDNEQAAEGANHNGTPYSFTARNYRPDHLAILPDQKGACSLSDGCGVLINGVSHEELSSLIRQALAVRLPGQEVWLSEVFNTKIIYEGNSRLYQLGFTLKGGVVIFSSTPATEVQRKVTFVPVTNLSNGGPKMDREKVIAALIANSCCWDAEDRSVLDGLSDKKLTTLNKQLEDEQTRETLVVNATQKFTDSAGSKHTYKDGKWDTTPKAEEGGPTANATAKPDATPAKPQTDEEWLLTATPGIRSAVQNAMAIEQREKKALVETLLVNVAVDEKQAMGDALITEPIESLQRMASLLPKQPAQLERVHNWVGAAGATPYPKSDQVFAPFGLPDEYNELNEPVANETAKG